MSEFKDAIIKDVEYQISEYDPSLKEVITALTETIQYFIKHYS